MDRSLWSPGLSLLDNVTPAALPAPTQTFLPPVLAATSSSNKYLMAVVLSVLLVSD